MPEKKITPIEAAVAVLNKAKEMYKNSTLAKSYEGFKAVEASAAKSGASDPAAVAAAAGREKYGKEAFQHAAATGHKMGKSEQMPMKGHIKLAKFVGRMEAKRGMGKSETGHEKGVATKMNPNSIEGKSVAGGHVRIGDEGEAKKQAVGRMMEAEKIKPKLTE